MWSDHGAALPPLPPTMPAHADAGTFPVAMRCAQDVMVALQAWVRTNAPSGLKWNASGVAIADAEQQLAASGSNSGAKAAPAPPPPAPRGAPPPPPPPPPPPGLLLQERPAGGAAAGGAAAAAAASGGASMSDVFRELSVKSGSVTSGLRKVTADMKTKNRLPGEPLASAKPAAAAAAAPRGAAEPTGTPR